MKDSYADKLRGLSPTLHDSSVWLLWREDLASHNWTRDEIGPDIHAVPVKFRKCKNLLPENQITSKVIKVYRPMKNLKKSDGII